MSTSHEYKDPHVKLKYNLSSGYFSLEIDDTKLSDILKISGIDIRFRPDEIPQFVLKINVFDFDIDTDGTVKINSVEIPHKFAEDIVQKILEAYGNKESEQ